MRRLPFILLLFFLGLGAGVYFLYPRTPEFPILPIGAYEGTISGISGDANSRSTFYIERPNSREELVVSILGFGFTPQLVSIPGRRQAVLLKSALKETVWDPIVVTHADITYTFTGGSEYGRFYGTYASSTGVRGKWELFPLVDPSRNGSHVITAGPDIYYWLNLKQKLIVFARELKELERSREQTKKLYKTTSKLLENPEALKAKSAALSEKYETNLQSLVQKYKEKSDTVSNLADEVELLGRISHKGKTINLARRMAKREAKWYAATWGEEANINQEAEIARELNIDLPTLNRAMVRAEEIARLRSQVNSERKLINDYLERLRAPRGPEAPAETEREKEKKKREGFWDRLFG